MSWKKIIKAVQYERPIQENPEHISREFKELYSPLHASINKFTPILEEFALKDKARSSEYKKIAMQLRKVSLDIKELIGEYSSGN